MDAQSDLVRVTVIDQEVFCIDFWESDPSTARSTDEDYVLVLPETLERWHKVWDAWHELKEEIEATLVEQKAARKPAPPPPIEYRQATVAEAIAFMSAQNNPQ
jgi:hypothetical protein